MELPSFSPEGQTIDQSACDRSGEFSWEMFENLVVAITVEKTFGKKILPVFYGDDMFVFFFTREINEKLKMMAHE